MRSPTSLAFLALSGSRSPSPAHPYQLSSLARHSVAQIMTRLAGVCRYDLTAHFEAKPAAQQLAELADEAARENIQQDRYGEGAPWLDAFQQAVATHLGKDRGLFVVSGVMAQSITFCIYASLRSEAGSRSFVCHPTSHLLLHEKEAYAKLLGFEAVVAGDASRPLTAQDVKAVLDERQAEGLALPCCIIIELPHREIGGQCTTWEDLLEVAAIARERGIGLHMDGARLWEAQSYYEKPLSEIAAVFDSVYVSFYKGLGAMTGAMLVGPSLFMAEAPGWNRRFGGNLWTLLPYALSCRRQYNTLGPVADPEGFPRRKQRLAEVLNVLRRELKDHWESGVVRTNPSGEPQVGMVHVWIRGDAERIVQARDEAQAETGVRVFRVLRAHDEATHSHCFEWNMGPANMALPDDVFVTGWRAFLNRLSRAPA